MSKYSQNSKFKINFKNRIYSFVLKLIKFIDGLPKENISRRLGDQLLRSGTSVLANYVEGLSASSKKDFINYFNTSLKSANESKIWLRLLRDSQRVKFENVSWLLKEIDEIAKIFASALLTLKGKKSYVNHEF